MCALARGATLRTRGRDITSLQVTNAVQVYAGALLGILKTSGLAVLWADTVNYEFLGVAQRDVLGNSSGSPIPEAEIDISGKVIENVSITGLSAVTSQGALVYATDDNTFTLTPTANVGSIGTLDRWRTGALGDVRLHTPDEHRSTPVA